MISFILAAASITLAVLILLLWPLITKRHAASSNRSDQNLYFARNRLQELAAQHQQGAISDQEYQALKTEIESNLVDDINLNQNTQSAETDSESNSAPENNRALIISLCLSLPALAVLIYALTGTPEALQQNTASQASMEDIMAMVEKIETRLAAQPDDLAGWRVIAPIYKGLNQLERARRAYLQVISLGGADSATYAELADLLARISGGAFNAEARGYIEQSLALDDNNQMALWLAGVNAMQTAQPQAAVEYWQRLMPLLAGSPDQQQELSAIIAQAQAETSSASSIVTDASISVSVSLDNELAAQAATDDVVFVVAQAKDGPRAPLAVRQLKVSDLPVVVKLSDQDAMLAQMTISAFDEIVVSARVSKSGQAIPQPGDLSSAQTPADKASTTTIELIINQIL